MLINTAIFVNASNPNDSIAKNFSAARGSTPYVLWQWMNGCVTKEGISYDLEAFKRIGIKNVQQFLVGGIEADINDPDITILGDKWMELMRFSLGECQRLGMDFGTHNCPGWSASGAPGLKVEESMQKLIWEKTSLSGSTSTSTPITRAKIDTLWNYYKDICLIAIPKNEAVLTRDKIIVITDGLDKSGQLKNALPQGEWDVLRFGHTTIGKKNLTAPVSGQGLEVDKLSRKALTSFWSLYPEKLLAMAGEHAGKTFKRFEIDSYEAGNQDWTPDMANEFMNRRGYAIYPWLVVIAGYTVESKDVTARFKYDWQRTINELFADNYYGYLNELIHKVPGLEFLVEPYGTGKKNFDELAIRGIGDKVMCEFWTKPSTWGWESILPVSSNAHVNGKKIVAAEAFTGQPQYAFQTDLAALKVSGDQAFSEGVNLFVLHASAHQPWPQVKPGMTMGWWGTQFGPSQTWWNHGAAQWVQYVTRCQNILQKGLFVGDLCYLQLYSQKKTNIPQGYKADICNEKEFFTRFSVKEKKLVLPDGMSYRILVLPDSCKIEPELARKIEKSVNDGAIVVGSGFTGSPGLNGFATTNSEIRAISERLFGTFGAKDQMAKNVRNIGKGKVYCCYSAQEALEKENISKDIEVLNNEKDVAWIHRNDGDEHYYFISNSSAKNKSIQISFRISEMQPEIWNPVTGQIANALVWKTDNKRTTVSLNMDANGSCFVVFRNKSKSASGVIKALKLNNDTVNVNDHLTFNNQLILYSKGVYKLILQNGKTITKENNSEPEKILLNDDWDVRFQENRGAPSSAHFAKLISWPLHADSAIKFFSGTAHYKKTFRLNSEQFKPTKRILIDLGEVKNVATITVNQKEVAVIWNPPFSVDITDYCNSGENLLEIAVTNLWPNRIIGDKTQPDDCVWGAIRSFPPFSIGRNLQVVPDWVKNKAERPSKNRITFCTVDFFKKDTPLLPSGLIGPVQITVEDTWDIYGVQ
ncbi:MAG: glycosyl hydrolase [Bacteroidota bacterium]|nr:glycosyl hydrolase [Bacteroidota bacterium]